MRQCKKKTKNDVSQNIVLTLISCAYKCKKQDLCISFQIQFSCNISSSFLMFALILSVDILFFHHMLIFLSSPLLLHIFLFFFFPWPLLFSSFFCHYFILTFGREESFYCTVPITPVKREVEELDTIEEVSRVARLDMHGLPCLNTSGSLSQVWWNGKIEQVKRTDFFSLSCQSLTPLRSCGLDMQVAVIFFFFLTFKLCEHHFPYV